MPSVEKDPDVVKLQVRYLTLETSSKFILNITHFSVKNIPMFLPIMRATLNLPAARDPEVLERLDPIPLYKFCLRYQNHLTTCANLVGSEQDNLTQGVKEVKENGNKVNTRKLLSYIAD